MSKKKVRPIEPTRLILEERGFDVYAEGPDYAYASGPLLYVRADCNRNVIEFGVAKTFDRWANSTDHTVHVTKWWDNKTIENAFGEAERVLL